MNTQLLTNVFFGIAIGVMAHSAMEPINIRKRVAKLKAALMGQPDNSQNPMAFMLDTPVKVFFMGLVFVLLMSAAGFGIVSIFNPAPLTALVIVGVLLLVKEQINTMQINAYHDQMWYLTEDIKTGKTHRS